MKKRMNLLMTGATLLFLTGMLGCGGGGSTQINSSESSTSTDGTSAVVAAIYTTGTSVSTQTAPIQVPAMPASAVPVTQEEIAALPDYDLVDYASVVQSVSSAYPQVSDETDEQRRLIVDSIRSTFTTTASHAKRRPLESTNYAEQFFKLTAAEKWLAILHPGKAFRTLSAAADALRMAQNGYPGTSVHNDKGDAFRHAWWNMLMCKRIDSQWAEAESNAHENGADEPEEEKVMDLHNNAVGRRLYATQPTTFSELQILVTLIRFTNQHPDQQFSQANNVPDTDSLIYLSDD